MRTAIDRIGKYELKAVLARTPLSTVYDGWDSDIARRVAIKLMSLSLGKDTEGGEAYARFKRGAQAAGQLNHPNIVGVYDYGETEDYAYLVMEFVNGPTLKSMFDDNQRFALSDICRIIGSILEALQYSHDRGVVHRDVKPANIMFTKQNEVKITDFGIARLEDSEMTQAGMVIGTPAYMSPEQFLGEKIDLRTDIYSTGVVLYHTLTGERPYEGNLATIMHRVLYGSPLMPSRVSTLVTPALDAVVTRAMARNREDRFRSAAEFNAALQAAAQTPVPLRSERRSNGSLRLAEQSWKASAEPSKPLSRKLAVIAFVISLLVAGSAIGFYGFLKPTSSPVPPNAERLKQDMARIQQQRDQARIQQQDEARQKQEQDEVRIQQEDEARLQQAQDQARLQQAQELARQRQDQEQARLQQEDQARAKQAQDQARLLQAQQDQARLQQARDQARQKQEQDQARLQQQQEQEQARLRQAQDQIRLQQARDQARPKQEQDQPRGKQAQDQSRQKQEVDTSQASNAMSPAIPVTSISGAAGLVCVSVTTETAGKFGLESPQGMVVTGVVAGGAAERAGIREHDVILKIKGAEAHDLSVLSRLAADSSAGQIVPLDIVRNGSHRIVQLMIDQPRH